MNSSRRSVLLIWLTLMCVVLSCFAQQPPESQQPSQSESQPGLESQSQTQAEQPSQSSQPKSDGKEKPARKQRQQTPSQCAPNHVPSNLPECTANALIGYAGNACLITIDRNAPLSPVSIGMPEDTTVYVEVDNPRLNETLQFVPSFSHINPPDVANTAIQTAITSPLPSLLLNIKTNSGSNFKYLISAPAAAPTDPPQVQKLKKEQKVVADDLSEAAKKIFSANTKLACLQAYEGTVENGNNIACASSPMTDPRQFTDLGKSVTKDITLNATLEVPVGKLAELDGIVSDVASSCKAIREAAIASTNTPVPASANPMNLTASDCDSFLNLSYYEKRLDDTLSDVLTAQKNLQAAALVLNNLPTVLPSYTYCMTLPKDVSGTINIVTQVPPSTTPATVASIPLSSGISHWLVSTGVAFSFAGANSYSNAPLLSNGQPVLDPSGKNDTIVTQSTTKPTVLFPVVMGHYMVPWFNRWNWENDCPRHCGFLLSGGAGANLTASQKSADFLGGISLQLGSVLITPAAHVTWDVRLTQGVQTGAEFGSSPPSPLPTKRALVTKFAIGISYILPIGGGSSK